MHGENRTETFSYAYHESAQGNVREITLDGASTGDSFAQPGGGTYSIGTRMESYTYDLYGAVTQITDPTGANITSTGSFILNPYLFQGRRWDPETHLYNFRNRYYDPVAGRFISRDPLGYVDSMSLYAFVNNSPINFTDPMGLDVSIEGDTETQDFAIKELKRVFGSDLILIRSRGPGAAIVYIEGGANDIRKAGKNMEKALGEQYRYNGYMGTILGRLSSRKSHLNLHPDTSAASNILNWSLGSELTFNIKNSNIKVRRYTRSFGGVNTWAVEEVTDLRTGRRETIIPKKG